MHHDVTKQCSSMTAFLILSPPAKALYRAHGPYTLVGPLVRGLVLEPLVALTSTTVYVCYPPATFSCKVPIQLSQVQGMLPFPFCFHLLTQFQ